MPMRPLQHRHAGAKAPELARRESKQAYDARRAKDRPWRAWYGLQAWRVARLAQLAKQPLCERHLARGECVPASVVNHRTPHKGDWSLFIDPSNHESTCKHCHDSEIQREERAAGL